VENIYVHVSNVSMGDENHCKILDHILHVRVSVLLIQNGYGKVNYLKCQQSLRLRQAQAPLYKKLENNSVKPLYLGCTTFTRLSRVLALVNLKERFGWSDKSFTELLVLLKNMLPEDNMLPKNHYEVKKILCLVGMEYQKIHACPNDCI